MPAQIKTTQTACPLCDRTYSLLPNGRFPDHGCSITMPTRAQLHTAGAKGVVVTTMKTSQRDRSREEEALRVTACAPTSEQFGAFQGAYDYFNRTLFQGRLTQCFLNFSRGSARNLGFFAPERWQSAGTGKVSSKEELPAVIAHEISLNPNHLRTRPLRDTFSTLVHEMCHLEQQEFGKPSRSGYHNSEWGKMMDAVGLTPSKTGEPGGARTGQQMTHYIVPGGAFDLAFEAMPAHLQLPWRCMPMNKKAAAKANKTKYTCHGCNSNIWGKPELVVICRECDQEFVENKRKSK